MKTKEELNALRSEVEALNTKLAELDDEELEQIIGGASLPFEKPKEKGDDIFSPDFKLPDSKKQYDVHVYTGTVTDGFEPK